LRSDIVWEICAQSGNTCIGAPFGLAFKSGVPIMIVNPIIVTKKDMDVLTTQIASSGEHFGCRTIIRIATAYRDAGWHFWQ